MDWIRGDRCDFDGCPSRKYRIEDNGAKYCEYDHYHGIEQSQGRDEDDFEGASHGRTSRKVKEVGEKVLKHLHGRAAFELYLLCYQLILRKQIWWLVHEKGMPKELEKIIRNLWALRLQNLTSRMEFNILNDSESQVFSSQSEETSGRDTSDTDFTSRAARSVSTPSLIQSLALCYMGIYLLRQPVVLGDFIKWVKQGDLLYLRAIKDVPRDMKDRLPGLYHNQLDPRFQLSAKNLHHAVTATFLLYQKDFGMQFPALNVPLQLFRYIEELALPIEIYPAAQRLTSFLSFSFEYPQNEQQEQKTKIRIIDFPEAQLVSALVIATKLLYPLDDMKRYPSSSNNPSAAILDWDAWEKAMQDYEASTRHPSKMTFEDAMKVTEMDVLRMSESKIDDYLDFYNQTWTVEDPLVRDKDADFRMALLDMFPVGTRPLTTPSQTQDDTLKVAKSEKIIAVQRSLKPRRIITKEQEKESGEKIPRPGSLYRRFKITKELEGHAKVFYTAVADLAGLPLQSVVRAVYLSEQRIEVLKAKKEAEDAAESEYTRISKGDS